MGTFGFKKRVRKIAGIFSTNKKHERKIRIHDRLVVNDQEKRALKALRAHGRSGHGIERALLLMKLAELSASRSLDIVEIGVYKGGSAQLILDATKNCRTSINIFFVDTFAGHPMNSVTSSIDGAQLPGQFSDTSWDDVYSFLQSLISESINRSFLVKANVMEVNLADFLKGRHIGMCHIDVDLFGPTLKALSELSDLIAPGGFFVVDDFLGGRTPGMSLAVSKFLETRNDFVYIPTIAQQAILVKVRLDVNVRTSVDERQNVMSREAGELENLEDKNVTVREIVPNI